jgi:Protein of unknown function (DUF2283)
VIEFTDHGLVAMAERNIGRRGVERALFRSRGGEAIMKVFYDRKSDALYLRLSADEIVESEELYLAEFDFGYSNRVKDGMRAKWYHKKRMALPGTRRVPLWNVVLANDGAAMDRIS